MCLTFTKNLKPNFLSIILRFFCELNLTIIIELYKAGNVCFTGHCSYYCDTTHAICGRPLDRMEGSVQVMLPAKPILRWDVFSHPYRRTYMKRKKALWEVDDTFCEVKLLKDITYATKLILDVMDLAVFDFITGLFNSL